MPLSQQQSAPTQLQLNTLPNAALSASVANPRPVQAANQQLVTGNNTQQQQQQRPARLQSRRTQPSAPNSSIASTSTPAPTLQEKIWPKVTAWGFNISLVILGIAIAWVYGRISQKQNNQNLMATLWRDCVDLPDVIGNTETCKKLLNDGFDSLPKRSAFSLHGFMMDFEHEIARLPSSATHIVSAFHRIVMIWGIYELLISKTYLRRHERTAVYKLWVQYLGALLIGALLLDLSLKVLLLDALFASVVFCWSIFLDTAAYRHERFLAFVLVAPGFDAITQSFDFDDLLDFLRVALESHASYLRLILSGVGLYKMFLLAARNIKSQGRRVPTLTSTQTGAGPSY